MARSLKLIIGLGKTGLSCARYLTQQGYAIAVTDSRENPPALSEFKKEFPQVPISLGQFDENLLSQADTLVVSPGISLKEPALAKQIAQGIPAIGDIELFARAAQAPIVAITGTNGKSTVTSLVGEMARAANINVKVGGNLGMPALSLLDDHADLYVVELSSFQLETTTSLKTAAATVLNIAPDHLDRYAGFTDYVAAKQRIWINCKAPIINRDETLSFSGLQNKPAFSFGLENPRKNEFGLRESFLAFGAENLLAVNELPIKGRHQYANALAALALGQAIHLPMPAMLTALKNFQGLAHRCQWIRNRNEVDWYNDSKGTNVSSSLAAIEGLGCVIPGKLILIAGGLGKQQDFSPLRTAVEKYVREVILIGQDAKLIAAILPPTTAITYAKDLAAAVNLANRAAKNGDAVLLSPACASFDMFQNFEHRGNIFTELVKRL